MDPLSNNYLGKSVDKALEKPASTIGESLNGLLLFTLSPLIKFNIRKEAELEAYKHSIIKEVSKIPEENLITPPLAVIGPALEASKFYIDEVQTQEMFAKLIAASMDRTKIKKSHHAFVEIIKQLSPLDALNLKTISTDYETTFKYELCCNAAIIYGDANLGDNNEQTSSIDNLKRLGLIDVIKRDPIIKLVDNSIVEPYFSQESQFLEADDLGIEREIIELTQFGIDFCSLCI